MHFDSPSPPLEKGTNHPLLIQSVTLSKLLATSIFIETPVSQGQQGRSQPLDLQTFGLIT